MTTRVLPLFIVVACLAGCAARVTKYQEALTRADAKAREGQAESASLLYQEAEEIASSPDLAMEARYREAWMWKKAGEPVRALKALEALARAKPPTSRTPRIWLDIGRWREESGDLDGARQAYRQVLSYPESGLAERAADALARQASGSPADAYRELLPSARGSTRFDSFLRLRIARAEVQAGRLESAVLACEDIARRDPLPTGVYTDEALLLAARLRRQLGDGAGALTTIDALLTAQEKSAFVGSYERPSFAEARWLAADIYAVDRGDAASAERWLEQLAERDATSRLRDDALFRAAWLARHARSDEATACARARKVAQLDPPSPLAGCLGEVCPDLGVQEAGSRRCQRAVTMAMGDRATVPVPPPDQPSPDPAVSERPPSPAADVPSE